MTTFTTGPWVANAERVEPYDRLTQQRGWANDGWIICHCDGPDGEANAHLIAAAPDLYEALVDLVRINEEWNAAVESIIGRPAGWNADYLSKAKAAIEKAEGDSKNAV